MVTLRKLAEVCRRLNREGVKYIVIGGCAIFLHGYERTTRDIDLLVEASAENIELLKGALKDVLPEAVAELKADDVKSNIVVRMVGEDLIVDLMHHVGDVNYDKIRGNLVNEEIDGVLVPIADVDAMLELKKGVREIDKKDYLFLKGKKEYLEKKKG